MSLNRQPTGFRRSNVAKTAASWVAFVDFSSDSSPVRRPRGGRLPLVFKRLWPLVKKNRKKIKKWIDGCGSGDVASRAATSEGGRETGCRSRCCSQANHPIGFLVPSKEGSLTVWPSTGRAKSGRQNVVTIQLGSALRNQGVGRDRPRNAGKRKKIELCAARLLGRAVRWMRIHQCQFGI